MQAENLEKSLIKHLSYLKSDPNNPQLQLTVGEHYLALEQYHEAIDHLRHCVAGLSDEQSGLLIYFNYFLACAFAKTANYEVALSYLKKTEIPDNLQPHYLLLAAKCAHQIGQLELGVGLLLRIPEKYQSADVYAHLSLLFQDLGEIEDAKKFSQLALSTDKDNDTAKTTLSMLALREGNFKEAGQLLENLPDSGRRQHLLGVCALLEQNLESAIVHLLAAIKMMPNDLASYELLIWSYVIAQQNEQALDYIERALQIDLEQAEIHGLQAFVFAKQDELGPAVKTLEHALKLNPASIAGLYANAFILIKVGREQEAKACVDRLSTLIEKQALASFPELFKKFMDNTLNVPSHQVH